MICCSRRREDFGGKWCRGPESNWLRPPFQGGALPVSYPGTVESVNFRGERTQCQCERAKFVGSSFPTRPQESKREITQVNAAIAEYRCSGADLDERAADDFYDWAFDASDR